MADSFGPMPTRRTIVARVKLLGGLWLAIVALAFLVACNASFTVRDWPYCPTSDSAKAKADSVPLGCPGTLPDTAS